MDDYGVYIYSSNFAGQTGLVRVLEEDTGITYDLGYQTIPFTFFPPDGSPQGKYFIYFYNCFLFIQIIQNIKCHVCDNRIGYTEYDKSQFKYEDKYLYLSSTQTLMNLENVYGPNFDKYVCKICIDVYFENTGNVIIY